MPEVSTLSSLEPEAPPQLLVCRLRPKEFVGKRGPIANMGEIELENVSPIPVEIACQMTALQYLHLVVTNQAGQIVSEGHFGDRFAPSLEPYILRLGPGEKFTSRIHLFATVPHYPVPSGTYTIQAVYDAKSLRAVSEPIQVTA